LLLTRRKKLVKYYSFWITDNGPTIS
jgi:hypothetical protein